jgi:poly(A) polymerase
VCESATEIPAENPENIISAAGFPVYLHGFSAIDSYLGHNGSTASHILCGADIADLARLFENLRYPGAAFADAALDCGTRTVYFRCDDTTEPLHHFHPSFKFLEFYQDCKTRRFYDPNGLYPLLRSILKGVACGAIGRGRYSNDDSASGLHSDISNSYPQSLVPGPHSPIPDMAMILAKYFPETSIREINKIVAAFNVPFASPCKEEQRLLLTGLLEAPNPAAGFELLKNSGYIKTNWPELATLDDVDHSKEFHPEGNVWKHTMETLRYRKSSRQAAGFDLMLSLALLLHDSGKPLSASSGPRRFDGHAELGERQARRFLERLDFPTPLVNDVCYLVRTHMLPAALPRLPLTRTGNIMASPLFPALLELYRCDESSSFKGLDGYYQSSAAYQSYLKYRRNPYRTADGKKLKRNTPWMF